MFLIILICNDLFSEKSSWLGETEDLLTHFLIFVQFQGPLCDPFSVTGLKKPNREMSNPVFLTILFFQHLLQDPSDCLLPEMCKFTLRNSNTNKGIQLLCEITHSLAKATK